MIFDKLTERDKSLIQDYIDKYAIIEQQPCRKALLSKVLKEWSEQKERLYHAFGDKFIVSEDIEYNESTNEILDHLNQFIWRDDECDRFAENIKALFPWVSAWDSPARDYYDIVCSLFWEDNLATNSFTFTFGNDTKTHILPLKDGKKLSIQKGMKTIKIIGKLAESYGIEGFEYFRNAHSRCLQTKALKGKLCLSIHPLDYMTMSDNSLGWSSCMSWEGQGEYRLGTVEMMNSPCIVVAYLADDSDIDWFDDWKNKQWRCLFIADENFIFSIKQYPYSNKNLIKIAASKLAETLGWGKQEASMYLYYDHEAPNQKPLNIKNQTFRITTETGAMYNDCGGCKHWVILNPNGPTDIEEYDYCYSGRATCMHCGDTLCWDSGEEGSLTCGDIEGFRQYCECCDHEIYSNDESYSVEGTIVCERCYENHCFWDPITQNNYFNENAIEIYISRSNEKLDVPTNSWEQVKFKTSTDELQSTICKNNYTRRIFKDPDTVEYKKTAVGLYWLAPEDLDPIWLHLLNMDNLWNEVDFKEYIESKED